MGYRLRICIHGITLIAISITGAGTGSGRRQRAASGIGRNRADAVGCITAIPPETIINRASCRAAKSGTKG